MTQSLVYPWRTIQGTVSTKRSVTFFSRIEGQGMAYRYHGLRVPWEAPGDVQTKPSSLRKLVRFRNMCSVAPRPLITADLKIGCSERIGHANRETLQPSS